MNPKNLCIIFLSIIFAGTVFLLTKVSFKEETAERIEKSADIYKNRLKACFEHDDDLLLNNLLDNIKIQPDVVQISVVENGRIIADTDAGEINSLFKETAVFKNTSCLREIYLLQDSFPVKNRNYSVILKLSGKTSKNMEKLKNNILTAGLIYLVLCLISLISIRDNKTPVKTLKPLLQTEEYDALSFLSGSKTAVVLVLTGDNRVLEASIKAREMFGNDIFGKNISEFSTFSEITEAISKGRKPVLSCGKKYFVL